MDKELYTSNDGWGPCRWCGAMGKLAWRSYAPGPANPFICSRCGDVLTKIGPWLNELFPACVAPPEFVPVDLTCCVITPVKREFFERVVSPRLREVGHLREVWDDEKEEVRIEFF
jgi:hypothetical protein